MATQFYKVVKICCHGLSAAVIALLALCISTPAVHAIIVLGPQERNLQPPHGKYYDSGWQYQGLWGKFLGTAISAHYFITARHVGGLVGDKFLYQGKAYETINVYKFPDCDLAIWTVAEPMPEYAPLYVGGSEVGREVVLFGRGTERGVPVTVDGRLRGWRWGKVDGQVSWGVNHIDRVTPAGGFNNLSGGEKLCFAFQNNGDPNTCSVSSGDSGGAMFIMDEGHWKLAGINHGVNGLYSATGVSSDEFSAAIFDGRGLWQRYGNGFAWTNELDSYPATTLSFSTRISTYAPEILDIINQSPHRQIFTRRRVALFGTIGFVLLSCAYIYRVRDVFRARRRKLGHRS